MPKTTIDPSRSFIRAQVPHHVHLQAKAVARCLNVTVAWLYNLVLSRELYDIDPYVYAQQLHDDLQPQEREESKYADDFSCRE